MRCMPVASAPPSVLGRVRHQVTYERSLDHGGREARVGQRLRIGMNKRPLLSEDTVLLNGR